MTRVPPRTSFHSSKLIRCLADLAIVDAADAGNAFAERLGEWIQVSDAITLSAVHSDGIASLPRARAEGKVNNALAAIEVEFERIQEFLVTSITRSCSPHGGKTHIKLPGAAEIDLPVSLTAAYGAYRRFYESHQRDMELSIRPLRVNVRQALTKASPRLKKLAELDAQFDNILRDRESKLLAKVPVLLKQRFERLFKEHQQHLIDTQQVDNPDGWMRAGGWLARFCTDMQMLLLAEVELRLQPTLGLIEASNEEAMTMLRPC